MIFNLAAQTSHMGGQHDPLADIAVNAVAQVRLIQAAREAAPDAVVVHASTRQFYGRAAAAAGGRERIRSRRPTPTACRNSPASNTGCSSIASQGRPVVSLRLTNCYGPRLRIRDARQTFLGIWIRCVLEGRPFEVWGGEQLRDLTYVDDVTEAFLRAAGDARLPRPDLQYRRRAAGLAARDLAETAGAARRRRRRATRRANFPPTARRSTSAAITPTTAPSARRPAGRPAVGLEEGIGRSLDWFRPRLADYL